MSHFSTVVYTASGALATSELQQNVSGSPLPPPLLNAKQTRRSRPNTKEELRRKRHRRKEKERKKRKTMTKEDKRAVLLEKLGRKHSKEKGYLVQEIAKFTSQAQKQRQRAINLWIKWMQERKISQMKYRLVTLPF